MSALPAPDSLVDPARGPFPALLPPGVWSGFVREHGLTRREAEIVDCMCRGASYQQIARHFGIARPTLRAHLRAAYRKIGCRSRCELILVLVHRFLQRGSRA